MIRVTTEVNLDHITELVANLRSEDQVELEALGVTQVSLVSSIVEAMGKPRAKTYVALNASGEVIAMGGLNPARYIAPQFSFVWLLGTNILKDNIKSLLKELKPRLKSDIDNSKDKVFGNFVHKDNKTAIRFIKYLGFSLPNHVRPKEDDLMLFTLEKENV